MYVSGHSNFYFTAPSYRSTASPCARISKASGCLSLVPALVSRAPVDESRPNYNQYEASPPTTPFSTGFVVLMTVKQCTEIRLPLILPKFSLRLVGWSYKVPDIAYPTLPEFAVPCHDDIRAFIGEQEAQYKKGFRSVILEFSGTLTRSHPALRVADCSNR